MDMSHLYHDANFGGPTIELDVKEQMRTREVNAREERNFERVSKSYEKAKCICEKNTTWERWKVGQTLHTIWERTPRLERSLALEKARVEALQRALIRRSYQRMNDTPDAGCELDAPSRQQEKVIRCTPKGSRRSKREQEKRKKDKKEEGRPLNTDFSHDRHLHRQTDFSRRSEHVVKALARLNWRQESRRRDHLKFKEELIQFSKPVIDRARVVLKGRHGMDVEQFLEEFQNHFHHDGINSLSKNSRGKGGNDHSLTQMNVLKLEQGNDVSKPFLPSVAATSSTDLTIIGSHDAGYPHLENDDNNKDEVDAGVKEAELDNTIDDTNFVNDVIKRSASEMKTESTSTVEKVETNSILPGRHTQQGIQNSKKNSKEFHLPAIRGLGTAPNGKEKPRHRADSNESGVSLHGSVSGKNSSLGSEVFSPSTSVSQVIIEEDDEVGSITPTYDHKHLPNFHTHQSQSVFFNDSAKEDSEETKRFATTCTIGLPQLWKQPIRKQKEKPTAEVSASTIARKHRRRANTQRAW